MITITDNELALLKAILNSEYHNGIEMEERISNRVWVDCINGFRDTVKFGGTMASVSKKGLAGTDGETCWITEAGFVMLAFPVKA